MSWSFIVCGTSSRTKALIILTANELDVLSVGLSCSMWNQTACSLIHEAKRFLRFCRKAIKSTVPGELWSYWASGTRVTDRPPSCSRPKELSFTRGDSTALLTWVILLSHLSIDPENMWVNCRHEGGAPLKSLRSRSGLRTRSNLVEKFRVAYLHRCSHLYCTRQQKNRRLSDDGSVSWEWNSSSCCLWLSHKLLLLLLCCLGTIQINSFPLLPQALINVFESS